MKAKPTWKPVGHSAKKWGKKIEQQAKGEMHATSRRGQKGASCGKVGV